MEKERGELWHRYSKISKEDEYKINREISDMNKKRMEDHRHRGGKISIKDANSLIAKIDAKLASERKLREDADSLISKIDAMLTLIRATDRAILMSSPVFDDDRPAESLISDINDTLLSMTALAAQWREELININKDLHNV